MGEKKNYPFVLSPFVAMPGEHELSGKMLSWANFLNAGGPAAEISPVLKQAYTSLFGLGSYLLTATTAAS